MENTPDLASTALRNYPIESNPAQITEDHRQEIKKHVNKKKHHLAELIIRSVLPPTTPNKGIRALNFILLLLIIL